MHISLPDCGEHHGPPAHRVADEADPLQAEVRPHEVHEVAGHVLVGHAVGVGAVTVVPRVVGHDAAAGVARQGLGDRAPVATARGRAA